MMLGRAFEEALGAARTGADWAWAEIYDDLAPVMLGYVRARGASEPDDLVGEIFLQIVRDLSSFDGSETEFRSWAFTIAHHRLLDDGRRRARRPVQPVEPGQLAEALGQGDAEAEALEALGTDRVRKLLATLTADQQDALLLRVVADLSVDDIARIMGKRPGAVKALQRRGLANLQKEMRKEAVAQ
jgi:RNA polymerase sigma factor (sigma-70 family)